MNVVKDALKVGSMEELKCYVFAALCKDNELLADAFPTTSTPVLRTNGELCGMIVCVHGPRTSEFSAIWEKQTNRVLFYRPNGERYRLTSLGDSPVVGR